ncbi:hypothetical protein [Limnohabitans lacus]|uniref:hypothetical protein n=1 Tax=Limnohabitans lacus TaxID=3045173 RepID=UPI0024B4EFFA|nr:hypothetical protein [Limnohabitans sp. HM2-2]
MPTDLGRPSFNAVVGVDHRLIDGAELVAQRHFFHNGFDLWQRAQRSQLTRVEYNTHHSGTGWHPDRLCSGTDGRAARREDGSTQAIEKLCLRVWCRSDRDVVGRIQINQDRNGASFVVLSATNQL